MIPVPFAVRAPVIGTKPYALLPAIGSAIALLAGLCSLAGWTLGVPLMYTMMSGWAAMVPETATGILACGGALWLMRRAGDTHVLSPQIPTTARVLSGLALILGATVLTQYWANIDLGLDRVLFADAIQSAGQIAGRIPGRMSPNTAIAMVLIATALLTLGRPPLRRWHASMICAVACLLVALVGVAGYIYGVKDLYGVVGYSSMSLPTALSFTALGVGTVFAQPDSRVVTIVMSDGIAGAATRVFLPMALLVPLMVSAFTKGGIHAGMYGPTFATALMVIAITCVLAIIVVRNARYLYELDELRHRASEELTLYAEEAHTLAEELEEANTLLQDATTVAIQSRTTAEAANHAKAEFLAMMSHELRTPLNATLGYADLLDLGLYGELSTEQRDIVKRITRSSGHLLSVVNDILEFIQANAGSTELRHDEVPVDTIIEDVMRTLTPVAHAKGVTMVTETCLPSTLESDDERLTVVGDQVRVEKILYNLVSNAIKFTRSGDEIMLQCTAADNCVSVRVSDNGDGINPETLEQIFEPFTQANQKLTRTEGGTGLGLALSRTLARAMGGDVVAQSVVGAGSVFTLTLPAGMPIPSDPVLTSRQA